MIRSKAKGHKGSDFTPPALGPGAHVAPLDMKFHAGAEFPFDCNNIMIAEQSSWNRHEHSRARITRVMTDPQGNDVKRQVFASGWLTGAKRFSGRPAHIVAAKDGAILGAEDWASAIYRISDSK